SGQSETAGMEIDPVPQVGDILGTLVGYPSHVVLVDQHGGSVIVVGCGQFLHINHSTVGDAACTLKPRPAFALQVVGRLGLASQKRIRREQCDAARH